MTSADRTTPAFTDRAWRGEPIVVLHSAGLDKRSADFVKLPGVSGVDLPGHGEQTTAPTTLQAMADEVARVLDGPTHVVGLSLGGMVAQNLALMHPDKVRSLVLGCTPARTPTDAMLERAASTEVASREALVTKTLERWFTRDALSMDPTPDYVAYARSCLERIDQRTFADVWRAIAGHDLVDRLGEVRAPTTCIAGTRDVSTPPRVVRELADLIPHSRFVEIDAPHMAHLEQPDRFAEALADHLDRVTGDAQ